MFHEHSTRSHRPDHPARGLPPPARPARAFLLESVERGRLGRYSLVGCGSRLSRLRRGRGARRGRRRLPRLRPRRDARADGAAARRRARTCPRAASSSPTCSSASTTRAASPRCSRGDPDEVAACSTTPVRRRRATPAAPSETRRFPGAGRVRARRRARARSTSATATRSRSCSRSGPSGAPRVTPLALYRSLRRVNPSPYLFLLELDGLALVGSSPETLVKLRGTRAQRQPDRRHDEPGEGDAERLLSSEKDRAEHVMLVDLGRNDLSRVCVPGHGQGRALPRAGAVLARHAPRLRGRRRAARRRLAVRPAARDLPRRHRLGRAEGARDADHLGARGPPPRPVRGRRRLPPPRRRARHVHRDPHGRPARRRRATSRPARASSPTPIPRAEHEECLHKLAALEAAIDLAEAAHDDVLLIDNYDSFTYNLAHLFGELGAEVDRAPQRRDHAGRGRGLAPSHLVVSPGPGRPEDAGATIAIVRAARRDGADPRRLPRPPGDRPGLRRRGRPGARARPRQGDARSPTTAAASSPASTETSSPAATTRSRRRRARRLRGVGDRGRRRDHGRPPPRAAASTASSSTPSRC